MVTDRNWAGNYRYNAKELHVPDNVEHVQQLIAGSSRIKVLGTRHSFNGIADCAESLISLEKLNRVVALDRSRCKVTVEAGIRYGDLCRFLNQNGFALHNLASLPHITISGACETATHGSGDRNGNLATAVHSMEVVAANGELLEFSHALRGDDFNGAVVGLGGIGAVTKLTLDVVPAYQMSQLVYENLPLEQLECHLDDIFSSAYSVSLFTDWKQSSFNQVWLKNKVPDQDVVPVVPEFYGATLASGPIHPVPGCSPENCSEQNGVPGPWHERLPHFRMEFTPSAGDELQSEYFVPRHAAYEALCTIDQMRHILSPILHVSEIRTIAADELWMSPCYKQNMVAIHFTWKSDEEAVRKVLPTLEKELEPFGARPHWGKLFLMSPDRLLFLYDKLPDFRQLLLRLDPQGKFRNDFLNRNIMGSPYHIV